MFEDTVSLPCVELPSVGRIWRGTSRLGSLMIPDPRMSGRQGGVQRAGGDAWQLVGGVSLFHRGSWLFSVSPAVVCVGNMPPSAVVGP